MSETPLTHWSGEPVAVWREAWQVPLVEAHARLGSTNDRARSLAMEGCEPFTVVLADEQTEGRGRGGAAWYSPAGTGLWMSAVLGGDGSGPALHLPLLVGLAAATAIEAAAPGLAVGLEWPNDLMVHGRKAGGVLCERAGHRVVVGIGINVSTPQASFPRTLRERATSLEAAGAERVSRGVLAGLLVKELRRWAGAHPTRLSAQALSELHARDALADRSVVTAQGGMGTARGIDPQGALLLERPDGSRVRVVAGSARPA